jgi:chromosome segregation ATPase
MPMLTSHRVTSGPLAIDNLAMAPDPVTTPPSWGRSNSHATAQSKTSQYIDKITSENEKLKRELKAERLAREDEVKRVSAARSKAEDSRAEHQHLQLLVDTNSRALERKDRKMEELKAQLEQESKRRKVAEQRAEEALKMLGDTRSETQRQLAAAYEQKHLAETNADTAREGYRRLTDSYEKRLKHINEELNELRKQRHEDADKIKRQDIISDQLQHELSRTKRSESKMIDMMGQYKQEQRKEMDDMVKEAERLRMTLPEKENEATMLLAEMTQTRDKMRWVMAQKKRQGNT